jgi:hypothetical protein
MEPAVSEVEVEVTLTNAFEHSLARRGQIGRENVRSDRVTALVDASAVKRVPPPFVADRLNSSGRSVRWRSTLTGGARRPTSPSWYWSRSKEAKCTRRAWPDPSGATC